MRHFFKLKPTFLIGLDIQPNGLRLLQVKKNKHVPQLQQIIAIPFQEPIFAEGKIKDWDKLTRILQAVVQEYRLEGAVAISLPMNLVRLQTITLPMGLKPSEIEFEIRTTVQKDFPGLQDVLCMDYLMHPLPDQMQQEIIFAVARQDYIQQYVNCLRQTGLKVKIIDVDIYALRRAISQLLNKKLWHDAILYLSQQAAIFACFMQNKLIYYQSWSLSGIDDIGTHLEHKISLFMSSPLMSDIKEITACGDESMCLALQSVSATWPWLVRYPQLFPNLRVNDFYQAWGLVLREVPRW